MSEGCVVTLQSPAAIPKASATDDFFSRHDDESMLEDDVLLDGVGNSSRL